MDHSHPTNRLSLESSQPEQLPPLSDLLSAASDQRCNAVTKTKVCQKQEQKVKNLIRNQIHYYCYY